MGGYGADLEGRKGREEEKKRKGVGEGRREGGEKEERGRRGGEERRGEGEGRRGEGEGKERGRRGERE